MSIRLCRCMRCNCQRESQSNICDDCMNDSHYTTTALSQVCKDGKHNWCLATAYDSQTSSTGECGCECHKIAKDDDLNIM